MTTLRSRKEAFKEARKFWRLANRVSFMSDNFEETLDQRWSFVTAGECFAREKEFDVQRMFHDLKVWGSDRNDFFNSVIKGNRGSF